MSVTLTSNTGAFLQRSLLSGASTAYASRVAADTQDRFLINGNGQMSWGPGGSTFQDASLYRLAPAMLATDAFLYTNGVSVSGNAVLAGSTGTLAFFGATGTVKKTGYGSGSQVVAGTKGALTSTSTLNDVITNLSSLIADLRNYGLVGA